ncbi:hypothetical protein Taro_051329 [Colocasia esculenta]|uniref:Equilibrative nucleotide transporter 3 n=1 Tax=Colocasia esculenta TaxID=4460 RepID=A0A843XGJ8_COLES|nr:hypothetical protein [Colocasia esculenta]
MRGGAASSVEDAQFLSVSSVSREEGVGGGMRGIHRIFPRNDLIQPKSPRLVRQTPESSLSRLECVWRGPPLLILIWSAIHDATRRDACGETTLDFASEGLMKLNPENGAPVRHEGKLVAMVVCWLLGNGCLFSWNSMLTIEDYYVYLFPRYHPTRVLTLVYQPFALGTLAILAYHEANVNTRKRNLAGYLIFFISSLLVIVLDLATSGRGGIGAFIGVCIISGAFGVADAHVQGGMVGDLSLMCPEFIQARILGQLTVIHPKYESMEKLTGYYRSKAATEGSKTVSADLAAGGIQELHGPDVESAKHLERLSIKQLFLQNMDYAASMFFIYVLTLSIFPGFLSEDTGSHSLGSWYALVLIAMYNVCDLIGRYIPIVESLKMKHRKGLMVATLSRFLLIPAFYFTAKYGDQGWMILLTSFLGLSNGYLTVCILTAAPKGYKGPEQNALGNLLVLCLLAGIFAGVTLDWLWLIGKGW